ncbi:5'-methylthioadenosine phosphorylase [Carboxydocella sporoproducens DSM 16521]|uniref:5'-methylthioadenosine phosphorylase n=2 Tax=Carboxydocella TaxID=178898 RepID=A0A1T4SDC5_9FIRM|nr:5'-methylthioadenosine phosphorylase [Carboxydocella thermautotrophica]AVX31980.1 5'-methylthioadenosine phosphorylase [Carboxydocella thermautotrophica]GAW31691.1 phosphorylase [Carboxydocella sp. JDF658]SKA26233.1 5'-methylthioadenosine phosphorylase [Carboxydocella sporoproducens DSM 16521]
MANIPVAQWAIIGGSSTNSISFPRDLPWPGLEIIAEDLVFATPWGSSPPFTYFQLGEKKVLTCRMHGWRRGVSRADASRQVFWVLREAGVHTVLAEGGVGSVNHLLRPADVVIPNDYIDQSMRKDVELDGRYLLVMRQALCPELRRLLVQAAEKYAAGRVFDRSIYACTDGRHFESPAEVQLLKLAGADVIGQSICPEVYLAREIGACYARVDLVVNYAEGIIKDWEHEELKELFYGQSQRIGAILLEALAAAPAARECGCADLRKPTLLKEMQGEEKDV